MDVSEYFGNVAVLCASMLAAHDGSIWYVQVAHGTMTACTCSHIQQLILPDGSPTTSGQQQPASQADLLPTEPAVQGDAQVQVQHGHAPQVQTSDVQCSGHGCPARCCGCFLKKIQQLSAKTYGCQLNGLPPSARLALVSLLLS